MDISIMSTSAIAFYRTAIGNERSQPLAVTGFGRQRISSDISGRTLENYALVWIERGQGWLETAASGRHAIAAPAVFFLFPGDEHAYGPDRDTQWDERWVLFEGTLANWLEQHGLMERTEPHIPSADAPELAHLFGMVHTHLLKDESSSGAMAAAALHLLILRAVNARKSSVAESERSADRALRALRTRVSEDVPLDMLANEFDVATVTLRRRCHEIHGVSPKALHIRLRLDRAKYLLAMTDESIQAVAAGVGFSDHFYFSRLFAKREGCSPSEFRRRNRRV